MLYPDPLPPEYDGVDLMAEGLMTLEDAADFSALSVSTLYRHMDAGRLPWCKVGASRRVPRVGLRIFLAKVLI